MMLQQGENDINAILCIDIVLLDSWYNVHEVWCNPYHGIVLHMRARTTSMVTSFAGLAWGIMELGAWHVKLVPRTRILN